MIHAVSLLISDWKMLSMWLAKKELGASGKDFLQEVKDEFLYLWDEPVILVSIGIAYVINIFVGTYQRFLPVFTKEVLNVEPNGLGILITAPGLGGVLSLPAIATAGERLRSETLLWVSALLLPSSEERSPPAVPSAASSFRCKCPTVFWRG